MSMNYILGDSLIRLKNGQNSKYAQVTTNFSKLVVNFMQLLQSEGYILDFQVQDIRKGVRRLVVRPRYYNNNGVINHLKLISKPGKRIFTSASQIKKFRGGLGMLVLSTSKGLLPDYKAINMRVGGEVLCSIF